MEILYSIIKQINFTELLNIHKALKKSKIEFNEFYKLEIEKLNLISEDSAWGLTNSMLDKLKILEHIDDINVQKFSKLKLKKIKNKIFNELTGKKIKVVFFCCEFATFPTYKYLYDKMINDDRFVCDLVHIPFFHPDKKYNQNEEIEEYFKNGYKEIKLSCNYSIKENSPDIAFFLKPYDLIPKEFYIDEIKKVVPLNIYIPYGMEIGSTMESMRYQYQLPLHDEAWFCVSYSKEHYKRASKYSKSKGKNFKFIGHPRMDLVNVDLSNTPEYIKIKELAKGRKIVLWNPHFTIGKGDNWGSFKEYGIAILKYFSKHKELFLLYRPHPFLKESLNLEYGNNSKKINDYNNILSNNLDNIYLDESGNYLVSMKVSDFMISDSNSFVPEYLIYEKPVIYTKKKNVTGFKNDSLEKMLYTCNSKKDIFENIEKLAKGIDVLKKSRKKDLNKNFCFDKKESVSDKIINIILNEYKIGGKNDK